MRAKQVYESISDVLIPKKLGKEELDIIDVLKECLRIINDRNYPKYLDGDIEGDPQDIQKMGDISNLSYNVDYRWFSNIVGSWDDGELDSTEALKDLKFEIEYFFETIGLNESVFTPKSKEEIEDVLINLDPRDALVSSIEMGNLEGVKYAIEKGADIDLIMFLNDTPLDLAFRKGNDDVTDFLVSMGARTYNEIRPRGFIQVKNANESINDIFKPKSIEELEKYAREYVRLDDETQFPVKIPKETLGGDIVYLISSINNSELTVPTPWIRRNERVVNGFVHTMEDGRPEWKMGTWTLNGVMVNKYSWYNEDMDLRYDVTKAELKKLMNIEYGSR
jgi:hypothetical protein